MSKYGTPVPKHTYSVVFGGQVYTRTTHSVYTHAAYSGDRFRGQVTFHKSQAAARRRAGQSGMVKAIAQPDAAPKCVVCNDTRTITERTATQGMRTMPCWHCSK